MRLELIKLYIYYYLSYDVASGSEIMPCIKIDLPLVVYRFYDNFMKLRFKGHAYSKTLTFSRKNII